MNTKSIVFTAGCMLFLMVFWVGIGQAAGIKERMKERLPAITQLKAEGVVGENNQGYLEFLGKDQKQVDVVNAENADRKTVYEAISKQQGVTPELVGKRRALQIVENALPGEWLQDSSGNWYQKK